ncbi:putative Adenylate/guanylate cyclase with TPR repeats [Candidatus Promineifilum breve]|uniref:Adenylate/guanylate cyclase with TPR repeats n=1 Tax=Candidatus Promineifilum breve TaxID=1806508 RepID=A0A170PHJ3_9CHLR|nr:tetratricopeptide repeat protein [Candidatus Promineifilum breve]CUS04337.2 putative Adenylate/guanylate cyclase with TPR repeats [Candidatus Promineifilum breve]
MVQSAASSPHPTRRLVPQFILDHLARGEHSGHMDAAGLFVDLSGFTTLTEALMAHGPPGAEVLAMIVESIFEPLINTVFAHRGFVIGYYGDAFSALIPADEGDPTGAARLAVAAAWRMRQHLAALGEVKTPYGEFHLSMKMGIDVGQAEWLIVTSPSDDRAAYSFMGRVVQQCALAENAAAHNEIILTPAVVAALGDQLEVETWDDHHRLIAIHAPLPAEALPAEATPSRAELARFLPTAILDLTQRGEFRPLIALFVDLQGTPGPAALQKVCECCFALQRQYGGLFYRINFDDKGCNLQLFWGAPTSQERDIHRALNFILELRRVCELPLRAGLTHRMAFAGFVGSAAYQEYSCYGRGLNLAARMMSAAEWGQIWLSQEIAQGVAGQFQIDTIGERAFKGFAVAQPVHQLLAAETDARTPFYSGRLVGRALELEALAEAIDPLFAGRFAGLAALVGEAGSGKSRLAYEFLAGLESAERVRVLRCQTDDILRQPLNPFRYALRQYFQQAANVETAINRDQFERILLDLIAATPAPDVRAELDRTRSFLGSLVDLHWPDSLYEQVEPQFRAENTFDGLVALFRAESLRRPLIILLEDIHHLDASSQAFLAHLARHSDGYALGLVATSRGAPAPGWPAAETPLHVIPVPPLAESAVAELVATVLGTEPPPRLARQLAAETTGNPLFVEQLLLYLHDNGLLETYLETRDRPDRPNAYLPADVRSLLMAQIDQLPPELKRTAQFASVLGREFDPAVLGAMLSAAGDLDETLATGSRRQIWAPLNNRHYMFHHGLLREVAYEMQLTARRRELHHRAADALIATSHDDALVADQLAEIAFHFDRAEAAANAGRYYGRAGHLAAADFFNDQAIAYYDRALALAAAADTDARYRLLLGREGVYHLLGRRDEQAADLQALAAVVQMEPTAERQAEWQLRQAAYALAVGDYATAIDWAERSASCAAVAGDSLAELKAYHRLGRAYWQQGHSTEAEPPLRRALALADAGGHKRQKAECLYDLGTMYQYQGEFRPAFDYALEAQELFQALHSRRGQIQSLNLMGNIYYGQGDYMESQEAYAAALALTLEIGWHYAESTILINLGNNAFELGNFDDAQRYYVQSVELAQRTGDRAAESVALDSLGLTNHYQGHLAEARANLEAACQIALDIHNTRNCGYSLTHLGFTLLELGQVEAAIAHFDHALTLRRELGHETAVIDTLAGLAAAEIARDQTAPAGQYVAQIVAWIKQNGTDGLELPIQTYWICYDVMRRAAAGDPSATTAADAILADGHALLQQRAGRINDPDLRHCFLQNTPFNSRLLAAWAAHTTAG